MHTILNSWNGGLVFHRRGLHNINLGNMAGDRDQIKLIMEQYAGNTFVLFEGGADISPDLYKEKNLYSYFNASRDAHECLVYELALLLDIPFLGICRGHQILNVLNGGTLYQDLEMQFNGAHRYEHVINLTNNQRFHELMLTNPLGEYVVNSLHHQGLNKLSPQAQVRAVSEDGLVEAVEYQRGLSVQWHPELLGHTEFIEYMFEFYVGT